MTPRFHQVYLWLSGVAILLAFLLPYASEVVVESCARGYIGSVVITTGSDHTGALLTAFERAKAANHTNADLRVIGSQGSPLEENQPIDFSLSVRGPTPKLASQRTKAFVEEMEADLARRDVPIPSTTEPANPVPIDPIWGKPFLNICGKFSWGLGLSGVILLIAAFRQQIKREPPLLAKEKKESKFEY